MTTRNINPWTWQDALGFSQAVETAASGKVLYCAGQLSVDADGKPLHIGDMKKQIAQAFDNLQTVLKQSGYTLAQVVKLNYYTSDMPAFLAAYGVIGERLRECTIKPSGTLLGVNTFAIQGLMVELEATAVR
jgi:enamine deaminase RidA (YjgF/YER057c/UK114 family)